MKLTEIVASRMYSWVYNPSADTWSANHLKVGGRAGLAPNPLFGRVTVRTVQAGQAATMDMYVRKARELNPDWQPSNREPRFEATENPCVFRSLATGDFQVMILNSRTIKKEFFVDGRAATAEEIELIKLYAKARKPRDPKSVNVQFPYVGNLANVDGAEGWEQAADDLD